MRKMLFLMINLAAGSTCYAAGDMLTPDEVQHTGVSARPSNDSSLFIGAGLQVGQGRTTEPGATTGTAIFGHVEPGYQMNRGEFGRIEFSVDLFSGTAAYRRPDDDPKVSGKVTQTTPFGLLLKAGYGYSLGGPFYGILNAGFGPIISKYEAEFPNGASGDSGMLSGIAWEIGWRVVGVISGPLDFTAGIQWMQQQVDVGKINVGGTDYAVDETAIANIPSVEAGLRLRL